MGILSVMFLLGYIFTNSHKANNTFPYGTIAIVLFILATVCGIVEVNLSRREPIRHKNPDYPEL